MIVIICESGEIAKQTST